MGFFDKVKKARKEREKLKAIEKSAFIGQKKLEDQRKRKEAAEKAAERGISKAKGKAPKGSVEAKILAAAKKEVGKWELKGSKPTSKKRTTTETQKPQSKRFPPQTKKFDGETYKITGHVSSKKRAEFIKNNEKRLGRKVRMIKSKKWGYLIYIRK